MWDDPATKRWEEYDVDEITTQWNQESKVILVAALPDGYPSVLSALIWEWYGPGSIPVSRFINVFGRFHCYFHAIILNGWSVTLRKELPPPTCLRITDRRELWDQLGFYIKQLPFHGRTTLTPARILHFYLLILNRIRFSTTAVCDIWHKSMDTMTSTTVQFSWKPSDPSPDAVDDGLVLNFKSIFLM